MPAIEVDRKDRQTAQDLVKLVRNQMSQLSLGGRLVLAVEMSRLLKPEIEELKRREKETLAK